MQVGNFQNILLLLTGHTGTKSDPYSNSSLFILELPRVIPPSSYWKNSPDPAELGTTPPKTWGWWVLSFLNFSLWDAEQNSFLDKSTN